MRTLGYKNQRIVRNLVGLLDPIEKLQPSWAVIDAKVRDKSFTFLTNYRSKDGQPLTEELAEALMVQACPFWNKRLLAPAEEKPYRKLLASQSLCQVFSVYNVTSPNWDSVRSYRLIGRRDVVGYYGITCEPGATLESGIRVDDALPESLQMVRKQTVAMREENSRTLVLRNAKLVDFYRRYGEVLTVTKK